MSLNIIKYRVFLKVLLLRAYKLASFKYTRVTEHKIQGVLENSVVARFAAINFEDTRDTERSKTQSVLESSVVVLF